MADHFHLALLYTSTVCLRCCCCFYCCLHFVRDALQETVGKMRQVCDMVISVYHTQASLSLLRKCAGVQGP